MSGLDDIAAWLESIGLDEYAEVFAENEFAPDVLPTLTDAHPKQILEDVAEWQKKLGAHVTINAFAYKADNGEDFMEKLAKHNGGEFKNIR